MCSHEFGAERRIRPARAAAGGRFAICDCLRPSGEGNWAREGFLAARLNLKTQRGYIDVDEHFQTSLPGVYAGGDCIRTHGAASTVMAVQDGKLAARAIHERLVGNG